MMFKNKEIKSVFEAKREEATEEWKRIVRETDLHTVYPVPCIIRAIKLRRMKTS
jgi:hypothetical protein